MAGVVYELTVAGALGPVLRSALAPCFVAQTEPQTVLRANVHDDGDLIDLLRLLESRGLDVADIAVVT